MNDFDGIEILSLDEQSVQKKTIDEFKSYGDISSDYEPVKLLGEGTSGKTWLAIDRETGDRVAIKALKLSGDLKTMELFDREAEVLKSLNINGVPKFYRSISPKGNASGTYFIVQEYIEFPSLQKVLNAGRIFSEDETLDIMECVTEILLILQTQFSPPIIHRDIKPSNILSRKDDWGVQVYLIDFGAVAHPQKCSGGSTIAGTFGYMAPEQLQGNVTIQSDFYSLGATAVHLLTGISPYKMESDVFKLRYEPVLDQYAPETSEAMRELLDMLLSPDPFARPASAELLASYIGRVKKQIVPKRNVFNIFKKRVGKRLSLFDTDKRTNELSLNDINKIGWAKATGTLRCVHPWMDKDGNIRIITEYTFNANGATWIGAVYDNSTNKEGSKCLVEYNPNDPRMNYILNWL